MIGLLFMVNYCFDQLEREFSTCWSIHAENHSICLNRMYFYDWIIFYVKLFCFVLFCFVFMFVLFLCVFCFLLHFFSGERMESSVLSSLVQYNGVFRSIVISDSSRFYLLISDSFRIVCMYACVYVCMDGWMDGCM